MDTKEKIMYESMKLFSDKGFEAVSIREIASNVGIVNSALYKHFRNKEDILNQIVEESKKRFIEECDTLNYDIKSLEDVKKICFQMFRYNVNDEWMIMFRKILTIEQFKNPQLKAIYKEFFIDQRINCQANLFKKFMQEGIMKQSDPYCLAIELYAPFYMYHLYNEEGLEEHLCNHVEIFFNNNLKGE